MRRLMKEIVELQNNPPEGVRVVTSEDNMLDVTGIIEGPGTFFICPPIAFTESGANRGDALRRRLLHSKVQVH